MTPDTEQRPAARYEEDWRLIDEALSTVEAHRPRRVSPTPRWPLLVGVLVVILGVVVIVLASTAPRGARQEASVIGGLKHPAALLGAPSKGSPFEDTGAPISASIGGTATWYCGHGSACTRGYGPGDLVAAVDPSLGIARGTLLTVRHAGRAVVVRAVDTCQCGGRRIIDLTSGAFSRLASLGVGVIAVELEVGAPRLPNTDTR